MLIEGQEKEVLRLFEKISKDPRNNGIVKLAERDFPDWSMGFRDLTSCSPNNLPGFIDIFGGKLNKDIAQNNKVSAISLLMNFVKPRT